ncbi:transposase [uncultured Draconibacterium sp.]|uniref:transposase n=1 Tax=uncultured Draconibacterium sp. TaxID=1573823 RepID=UPI002AA690E7|nr:transposase [uncultured Draconibacterium sp.]
MRNKRFSKNQIKIILNEYEAGKPIPEIIEKYQISQATFYNWKAKYQNDSINDPEEIKKLKEDNERLRRMFVDISLENQKLKTLLEKYEESIKKAL